MSASAAPPAPPPAGVLSVRRLAWCLLLAALLMWPMALVTAPIVYFDSYAYASAGRAALAMAAELLPLPEAAGGGGTGAADGGDDGASGGGGGIGALRSAAWSVSLALLGGMPWGAVALCVLQAAATLLVASALIPAGASGGAIGGAARWAPALAATALLTGLPWYAAYAMPDLLGALVIAYYAVVAAAPRRLGAPAAWTLAALATYAVLGHYGHVPLAAGLAAVAAVLRWRRMDLAAAAMLAGPVLVAVLVNVATSAVLERAAAPPAPASAQDAAAPPAPSSALPSSGLPSAAPRRLPILLARSIEDGPALRHLREACAENLYATCDLFDQLPRTATALLWGPDGIRTLSAAQMAVLRAEEMRIVLGATRAYPAAQAGAFAQNIGLQLARVGVDQHFAAPAPPGGESAVQPAALMLADRTIPLVTALAALALLWRAATGRLDAGLRPALWVLAAGLAANAVIYGGLSYPVDRYQGRIAWLIPALLALDLVTGGRTRRARA